MNRLLALSLTAAAVLAAPAAAQDSGGDKVRMVIVYGDDQPDAPQADEILVVAHLPEGDRFRIPETLRFSDDPKNMAWARRVEKLDLVGQSGTLSCSTAGAGGFTGCTQQLINAAYADKRENQDVRFSELISAARAERLSTIDADASETQKRVEAVEQEYMDRLKKESETAVAGEAAQAPAPAPLLTPPLTTPPKN